MASCSRRSRTGSSNTRHQSLYAIGGIALTWVVAVPDSLNCDGTGATGGWYLGPSAQADSDITRASPMAKALDCVVVIRGRVLDTVIDTNRVRRMVHPCFPPPCVVCPPDVGCTATAIPSTR